MIDSLLINLLIDFFLIFFLIVLCLTPAWFFALRKRSSLERRINSIPIFSYRKENSIDECSICFDAYEENDQLRVLSCNHKFHAKCVDVWFRNEHRQCPLCRYTATFDSSSDYGCFSSGHLEFNERTPLLVVINHLIFKLTILIFRCPPEYYSDSYQ
ncbi:hypothetical protein B4U80_03344 [Leptotrombidium deliense]|uniref:RING-type domain-containing protein n=1 Tax=Leptotrombidium deliense TaxID=299467 RepID=A0A443RUJ1_9ACAR|nr:hypothetical protein B4U80_03344 [Leptotrombidium deliense]